MAAGNRRPRQSLSSRTHRFGVIGAGASKISQVKNIRFLEIAQLEFDEAVEYYNAQATGLGDEFLLEVLNALERVRNYPEAWQQFTRNTRRCRTRRFSFGIRYQVLESEILIVAVAHLHREPGHWQDRI